MEIDGINWVLDPQANNNPVTHQVATFSTYFVPLRPITVTNPPDALITAFGEAVGKLLDAGVTVIASANNQNGDACDTTPGLLSRDNPTRPAPSDPGYNRYRVITVGGTMLVNNPDGPSLANGGSHVGHVEPDFDRASSVREARWMCTAGDSDECTADGALDSPTSDPHYQPYLAA